ncbi:helix-turn-helix domain-containing protein [uncultured Nostoc sp.]|uniref:helix-turn-helix domain-containing protein n=1 Tax=uncultured Nostoc sp. TaxID=340711 RepID=UPI0035CC4D3C
MKYVNTSIGIKSIYELSVLNESLIVEHSRLNHLQPIGVGTSLVESLTGYIARLAESHCLLPGLLIHSEIAPLLKKVFVKKSGSRGLRAFFDRGTALNGTGNMAKDLVQALEILTLRSDLSFLTMLSWTEFIPPRGLFRSHKAWCSLCYDEWHLSGQVVYEPLLWAIDALKLCSYHHQPLSMTCSHCHQQMPLLTWRSRPGHCSNCGGWLGISQSTELSGNTTLSLDELKRQIWIADVIGELLALAPGLSSPVPKGAIAKSLRTSVDILTEGNVAALARLLGIPKNTLWGWHNGKFLPLFDDLLKICHFLGISLSDFLTKESITLNFGHVNSQQLPTGQHKSRKPSSLFDLQRVQDTLLAVLESSQEPPATMQEVADSVKYDRRTILRHFPDLCRAILAKSRSYKNAQHIKKIEQSCEEVRQIASQLRTEKVYPSEARVAQKMTMPRYLRYKQVRTALQEAKFKMGH